MTARPSFRNYSNSDRESCLAIFDANCPDFFAPNERVEYAEFLDASYDGYEVCECNGKVVGAFGLLLNDDNVHRLNWIMLDPGSQGGGLGLAMMEHIISTARGLQARRIGIAASHRSAPFFAKFGAKEVLRTEDGWGPGMHRVDMEITL